MLRLFVLQANDVQPCEKTDTLARASDFLNDHDFPGSCCRLWGCSRAKRVTLYQLRPGLTVYCLLVSIIDIVPPSFLYSRLVESISCSTSVGGLVLCD